MKRLFWLPVIILVLVSCQSDSISNDQPTLMTTNEKITIFLINSSEEELSQVRVNVDNASLKTQVDDVLDYLSEGVDDPSYLPTLDDRYMIGKINIENNNLILDMDRSFQSMGTLEHLYLKASLIKSLTNIDGVDSVEFYVAGYPMRDSSGKLYGPYYSSDVSTNEMMEEEKVTIKTITLYFPDAQGESLVPVTRQIEVSNFDNLEMKVLEELMILPETDSLELALPMPEETVVKSVRVSNGICYIDFNAAFKSKHYGGSTGETMTVYSIVNTITELSNISRVQFLIEGEKTESFKGHLAFDGLFEYNISLVNQAYHIREEVAN